MRAALLALFAVAASGCARGPAPCVSADACGGGECLANRCVPAGSDPVPRGTSRVVLLPTQVAVVGSRTGTAADTVTLGDEAATEILYVAFGERPAARVHAAFLLLEPAPATEPNPLAVEIGVHPVREPWTSARAQRGARPRLGPPASTGYVRSAPRAVARVDVTRLVRTAGLGYGLAVLASRARGGGVTVYSGTAEGAPRLELYVDPSRDPNAP